MSLKVQVPTPAVIANPPLQHPLRHELFEQVVIVCDPISEQDLCFSGQKPCMVEKLKSQHKLKQRTLAKSWNSSCLLLWKTWRNKSFLFQFEAKKRRCWCVWNCYVFVSYFLLLIAATRIMLQFILYGIWKCKSKRHKKPRTCREVLDSPQS